MKYIGSSEAKEHFFDMIKQVKEHGETYVVTYKGEPAIRVSSYQEEKPYSVKEAIEGIKAFKPKINLSIAEIKEAINWGRKY